MDKIDIALADAPVGSFPFIWLDKEYEATASTAAFVEARVREWQEAGKTIFDGPQIRLMTTPTLGGTHVLQPTSYYRTIATNRNPAYSRHASDRLEDSPLSNNIAMAALPVTRDGFCVVRRQGAGNTSSAGLWVAGSLGGIEPDDIVTGMLDIREIVIHAARRELREENPVPLGVTMRGAVVGYRRDRSRAGQPTMLVVIDVDATFDELAEWHRALLAPEEEMLSGPPVAVPVNELLHWVETTHNVSWSLTEIARLVEAHKCRLQGSHRWLARLFRHGAAKNMMPADIDIDISMLSHLDWVKPREPKKPLLSIDYGADPHMIAVGQYSGERAFVQLMRSIDLLMHLRNQEQHT